jgi:hypothetical protein
MSTEIDNKDIKTTVEFNVTDNKINLDKLDSKYKKSQEYRAQYYIKNKAALKTKVANRKDRCVNALIGYRKARDEFPEEIKKIDINLQKIENGRTRLSILKKYYRRLQVIVKDTTTVNCTGGYYEEWFVKFYNLYKANIAIINQKTLALITE